MQRGDNMNWFKEYFEYQEALKECRKQHEERIEDFQTKYQNMLENIKKIFNH